MRSNFDELPTFESNKYTSVTKGNMGWYSRRNRHFPETRYLKYRATLKGCVGMKWDDVYSKLKHEFKDILDKNHTISVELNCFTKNGKVYSSDGRCRMDESTSHYRDLYVAEDGILRQSKHIKYERRKRKPFFQKLGKLFFHKDINGIWWECTIQDFPESERNWSSVKRFPDAFYGYSSGSRLYQIYGKCIYVSRKQQCGKRLCKKLNEKGEANV